jgi:hypothetical protein
MMGKSDRSHPSACASRSSRCAISAAAAAVAERQREREREKRPRINDALSGCLFPQVGLVTSFKWALQGRVSFRFFVGPTDVGLPRPKIVN